MSALDSMGITRAITALKQGQIIAYPTEGVYGLGCDPFNAEAVATLIQLKGRPAEKGLILVANSWQQITPLIRLIPADALQRVQATWPGPTTWVFPASTQVPRWIRGNHDSIALRISDHPTVAALCQGFGGPIVSTSVNRAGQPAARDDQTIQQDFGDLIAVIVPGSVGPLKKPTLIKDALTDAVIRS